MKLLVLRSEWKFNKLYKSWLTIYRNHKDFVTMLEVFVLMLAILVCGVIYLLIINKSSTEWYFLKQANSSSSKVDFQYKIVKTDILDLKQSNWDKLNNFELYWPSVGLLDSNIESIEISQKAQHTSW